MFSSCHSSGATIAALLALASLGLTGCQESIGAHVTGVVTYQGEPLPFADIRFLPDPLGPRGAIAKTDDAGRYELMFDVDTVGIYPGEYKVVISTRGSAAQAKRQQAPAPSADTADAANPYANNRSSDVIVGGREMLPMKYCSSKQTVLTANVQEGSNTIDFHLD
ncbi:carboxypeptidase-like regulatory domain-containing protein [Blastopirellula sp. J2-11]|uniref:carboxypeptidase-like regulatory domain-containing protein n=1 Tax=Blastopirellula sp. J2-11 TaxID=2943192 RepID=UPI0021C6966F|nr:carboxypeptidase-like regulatory domain-containing protein [Blastopirellula sp. J2-11]UUO07299.1 carboxypeptidase-like regulatory domain-containing protein [Blastopirellula sp. J2-11]